MNETLSDSEDAIKVLLKSKCRKNKPQGRRGRSNSFWFGREEQQTEEPEEPEEPQLSTWKPRRARAHTSYVNIKDAGMTPPVHLAKGNNRFNFDSDNNFSGGFKWSMKKETSEKEEKESSNDKSSTDSDYH